MEKPKFLDPFMTLRYLDPKNDLAFKKIFGTKKHKRIPINFLNAVLNLDGEDRIIDLEFLNPKQAPEIDARKESIVDVLVSDQKGVRYIVEMQVASVEGFEKRAQYYAAKTYCSHFGRGGKYHDLKKVVFLAITDYIVFPDKADRYKSDHVILDTESYEQDLKDFSFTFVELPKFTKKLHELETIEERWYYFLKHAEESENKQEIIANSPEIKEAYEVLDRYHWSEEELQWYEKVIMNIADAKGIIAAAKKEGATEGRAQGRAEGKAEGIALGRAEGKAEGIQEGKLALAKQMLERGLSPKQVAEFSDFTEEELEQLQLNLV